MLYSAIIVMCSIGRQISAKFDLQNHLRLSIIELFCKITTKMADRDVNKSNEKTVNEETLWRLFKNKCFILLKKQSIRKQIAGQIILDFNVLMAISANGRNQIQETQLACRALNTCKKLWEIIFQQPSCIETVSLHILFY